jgi:predicted esterase
MAGPLAPHGGQPVVAGGVPLAQARAAMIMVHGRNAGPRNILDLATRLDRPGLAFAYRAPAAAGNTWYPYSFMAETDRNEPGLSSGLSVLAHLVAEIEGAGIPRRRIVLLGFSQGGCLTAEFAVRNAGRYGGVIVYSGGLIGPEGTVWRHDGRFDGTPVFLGCSDVDGHVPRTRVDETAAVFERMGAAVTQRIYPGMGHLVNDDEIEFTRGLMRGVVAEGCRPGEALR